jgi:hypothetical protein
MNKQGKLFGKVHILDVLVIIIAIVVVIIAFGRLSGNDIVSFNSGEDVRIRYTVLTYDYEAEYFKSLRVGDVLAEDKKYLDGEIVNIEIEDKIVSLVDNNGDVVTKAHPVMKRAFITMEATVEYKNPIYKLGKQELREGLPAFVVTEINNLSGIVSDLQVIE